MTCVIEDLQRRLKVVCRAGMELNVMKRRYNVLLPFSTANRLAECLSCLLPPLLTDGDMLLQLNMELKGYDGTSREQVLQKTGQVHSGCVLCATETLLYSGNTGSIFQVHIW